MLVWIVSHGFILIKAYPASWTLPVPGRAAAPRGGLRFVPSRRGRAMLRRTPRRYQARSRPGAFRPGGCYGAGTACPSILPRDPRKGPFVVCGHEGSESANRSSSLGSRVAGATVLTTSAKPLGDLLRLRREGSIWKRLRGGQRQSRTRQTGSARSPMAWRAEGTERWRKGCNRTPLSSVHTLNIHSEGGKGCRARDSIHTSPHYSRPRLANNAGS
jgi:hypothetical protein